MRRLLPALGMICLLGKAWAGFLPYEKPEEVDVKWPDYSYRRQPWRSFVETRSGWELLDGLGVNYKVRTAGEDEAAIAELAAAGFRRIRLEIPWGAVKWEETAFKGEERLRHILELCRQKGIRPLVLLNAHHSLPCPSHSIGCRVMEPAAKSSRRIRLDPAPRMGEGFTGIDKEGCAAGIPITAVIGDGWCEVGAVLGRDYQSGENVRITTLKYAPLAAPDDSRFGAARDAWVRYADLACALVKRSGIEAFDVEIWNELTFGSKFLSIENYLPAEKTPKGPDLLRRGERCWLLAEATVQELKRQYPQVKVIWGFSNTTFFHTPEEELPAGIAGQSYHPYGITAQYPDNDYGRGHGNRNVDGEIPSFRLRLPEGRAATFLQTESLMRLLAPATRGRGPGGVGGFEHYMTEHGVAPKEWGISGEDAWSAKTKSLLRAACFWLNKGITGFYWYCAKIGDPDGFGLLADKGDGPGQQPLQALHNISAAFAGSVKLEHPAQLSFAVDVPSRRTILFSQTAAAPALYEDELLCLLPFQIKAGRFIVVAYQMTFDVTATATPATRRVRIGGLDGDKWRASLYDPITDQRMPLLVGKDPHGAIELSFETVDYPRLIELEAVAPAPVQSISGVASRAAQGSP